MSGTKFFIHGGGTWRELDENNGRVTGWGKVHFVYLSRGRLVYARRNSVLKGLRALLAGKPANVRDGPRLPIVRRKSKVNKNDQHFQQNDLSHCKCCTCQHALRHNQQLTSDLLFNALVKQNSNSTATQCSLTADNSIRFVKIKPTEHSVKSIEKKPLKAIQQKCDKVPRKELIIDEEDVLLVRTFIEHDTRNVFDVSLVDYDADDSWKRFVFYKINPLVVVRKCSHIADMVRSPSQCSSVSLEEFIANLGLQSIDSVQKKSKYKMRQRKSQPSLKDDDRSNSDTDKENIFIKRHSTNNKNTISKSVIESNNKSTNVNKNEKKTYQMEPLSIKCGKNPQKKTTGVKHNSLLNMARRLRSGIKANIEKKGAGNPIRYETKNIRDKVFKPIFNKSLSSRHRPDKTNNITLLKRKEKKSVSTVVNSDSESTADKVNFNSINEPRSLRSSHRDRSHMDIDKKSLPTKESSSKCTLENFKPTNQLSKSLPTRNSRTKITDLPFENSDEDTFQKDKTREQSKIENQQKPSVINSKQQNNQSKEGNNKRTSEKKNITIFKRAGIRPYSRAEDEAIVSWLKTGERAHLVNGNRLWKELKPIHHQTTGHHRPWQSLRNRYLRYILPALSSLAVPPALAQKLRAAAAQGEIKSKGSSTNNSIFKAAPVRSAWALRPKSPIRSPPSPSQSSRSPNSPTSRRTNTKSLHSRTTPKATTSKSPQTDETSRDSDSSNTSGNSKAPFKRQLRSSAIVSPTLPTPKPKRQRDSLTYSELTRRFASRHRSTPQSGSSTDARPEKRLHDTSDSDEGSSNDAKIRKNPKHNDSKVSPSLLTRMPRTRSSKRFRSETPDRPRTRRLYNPRAV